MIQNNTIIHKKNHKNKNSFKYKQFYFNCNNFLRAIIKFQYRVEKKNIANSVNYY